jgi:predicted signal transduction protein with EAL and GGDEF domain
MDIKAEIAAVEARATAARVTVGELLTKAGISRITYWRAREGMHKRPESAMKVLRKLEKVVTRIEAKRAST